jgi:hypothetical protein
MSASDVSGGQENMILRDLASAWVRANCPRTEVQNGFLQRLDDALRRGVGCSFVIGKRLTKDGKPYLVHCFCGELFAFPLTPRQAEWLHVSDVQLVSARGLAEHNHEPHADPPVRLEQVQIDSAEVLDRSKPIKGTLNYQADQFWVMRLAIQAACEPAGGNSMVLYHHLHDLPRGAGTIRFQFPPIGELKNGEGQPFVGVLPIFFQICIVGEPEKTSRSVPGGPTMQPGHFLPPAKPVPPPPPPFIKQKLGDRFTPPSPTSTLMTPQTMTFPSFPDPWQPEPKAPPNPNRFRSISDIRAAIVEVG